MSDEGPHSDTAWARGAWMQTYTGRQFYPLDPHVEDIDPRDIAHALSLICRYGGHVHRFYSVAEHCVLMSRTFGDRDLALWALLHDATEAYVGDMVRPLKHHMPAYRAVEDRLMGVIAARFGLELGVEMPAAVKEADNRILLTERTVLMPNTQHTWTVDGLDPLPVGVTGWSPQRAESEYINQLHLLGGVTW